MQRAYPVRTRGAPPYGWLDGLAGWLNKTAGKGNWAFSGSFAMYCWAWVKSGNARDPGDIDIIVADAKFSDVAFRLYGEAGEPGSFNPPGPTTPKSRVDATLDVIELDESVTKFPTHVDILRAGSKFGGFGNIVYLGDNFPVLPLDELVGRKQAVLKDLDPDFETDEIAKAKTDIELLTALNK